MEVKIDQLIAALQNIKNKNPSMWITVYLAKPNGCGFGDIDVGLMVEGTDDNHTNHRLGFINSDNEFNVVVS